MADTHSYRKTLWPDAKFLISESRNVRDGKDKRRSAFGREPAHNCRSRNAVHPILLSPKPCPNSDKTGSPNGTRSLANASNRRIGSRKNFSPSTDLIAILRQRVGKLARVQARVSKRVGATTPICGNPNSIALGEIRFVGGRQGGGSEKGGEQHQRRWLHQPLVSAIRNGSGSSQCLEVGVPVRSGFLARDRETGKRRHCRLGPIREWPDCGVRSLTSAFSPSSTLAAARRRS